MSEIIVKCKSKHYHDKTPYHLDDHGIAYRKVKDRSNDFHAIMVPPNFPTFCLKAMMLQDIIDPQDYTIYQKCLLLEEISPRL